MRILISLMAGGQFGDGLFVSGMTDTTKVQGWLDVFGDWDPTLAFVMTGAIIPMFFAWRLVPNRTPLTAEVFPDLPAPELDHRLITGSVMFGMGWGLSGLCPGPAIASISYGGVGGLVFVAAMLAGMVWAPSVTNHLDRLSASG